MSKMMMLDESALLYWCPGCEEHHAIHPKGTNPHGAEWAWNGDLERPTCSPSVLCWPIDDERPATKHRCHHYVRNGQIQYLGDCTHALAGQTVDMLDMED